MKAYITLLAVPLVLNLADDRRPISVDVDSNGHCHLTIDNHRFDMTANLAELGDYLARLPDKKRHLVSGEVPDRAGRCMTDLGKLLIKNKVGAIGYVVGPEAQ